MERKADGSRFAECLLAVSEVYGKPISGAVAEIWWNALRVFDVDAVESAFQRHLTSPDVGQHMPKPADIVRMLQGSAEDAALVAWAKVDKAVRTVGPYPSVTFDDPLIQRVLHDMGGWIGLGAKQEDEWPFVGREFQTRYRGYRSTGAMPEFPPRLPGITEASNAERGIDHPEVVFVGDAKRAAQVAATGTRPPVFVTRQASATVLQLIDGGRQQ